MRAPSRFAIQQIGACGLMLLGIWCASGTLSPYAATLGEPRASRDCHYLWNIDHPWFQATFLMLDGAPAESWKQSVVLRRVLYPLVAYPFMKAFGYEVGGVVANMILHGAALVFFTRFVRRTVGERGAVAAAWLLATYPGIAYWAGLPYSYAAIVPACLFAWPLLVRLDDQACNLGRAVGTALLLGVCFTAYDLAPFFGLAAVLVLLAQRRWWRVPAAVAAMAAPQAVVLVGLKLFASLGPSNANTRVFGQLFKAYTSWPDVARWWPLLADVPRAFAATFLFGNYVFLPVLALLLAAWMWALRRVPLPRPEAMLLWAGLFVFLLNNLAPPYSGWQLRSDLIVRLYQPLFVVALLIAARAVELARASAAAPDLVARPRLRLAHRALMPACVLAAVLNAGVTFGPLLHIDAAATLHHRFYRYHASANAMNRNLDRYGRRPLGFCAP